jgi:uncharacterized protein with GYD domain
MINASYAPDGLKGVMAKGGWALAEAIEKLAAGVGGSVDGVDFSFGSDDLYAIVDPLAMRQWQRSPAPSARPVR